MHTHIANHNMRREMELLEGGLCSESNFLMLTKNQTSYLNKRKISIDFLFYCIFYAWSPKKVKYVQMKIEIYSEKQIV